MKDYWKPLTPEQQKQFNALRKLPNSKLIAEVGKRKGEELRELMKQLNELYNK